MLGTAREWSSWIPRNFLHGSKQTAATSAPSSDAMFLKSWLWSPKQRRGSYNIAKCVNFINIAVKSPNAALDAWFLPFRFITAIIRDNLKHWKHRTCAPFQKRNLVNVRWRNFLHTNFSPQTPFTLIVLKKKTTTWNLNRFRCLLGRGHGTDSIHEWSANYRWNNFSWVVQGTSSSSICHPLAKASILFLNC